MHKEFLKAICDIAEGSNMSLSFLESAINGYMAVFGANLPVIRFGKATVESANNPDKAVLETAEMKEYLGVEMGLLPAPKRPTLGGFVGVVGLGKQGKGYNGETPLVQFDWNFDKWLDPHAEAVKVDWKKDWLSRWEKDGVRMCGMFGGNNGGIDGSEGVPIMVDTSNLLAEVWFDDPKHLSHAIDGRH